MRNWNFGISVKDKDISSSLSRAYEELKLGIEIQHRYSRNAFIACLWGIETKLFIQGIDPISLVYRVPMRNWNIKPSPVYFYLSNRLSRAYEELKRYNNLIFNVKIRSLSRAYEELKRRINLIDSTTLLRLSRAYEELKPLLLWFISRINLSLSRAYEELKQDHNFWYWSVWCVFIACLWGIETLSQDQ